MPIKNHNLVIGGLCTVLFGVVCYFYWSLLFNPISIQIATHRTTIQDLNGKLEVAKARASQLSKIQAEMASLQVEVSELEKMLPKTRELPSLLRLFTHRAEANGISVSAFRPNRPTTKGLYDEVPYEVNATSSMHSLVQFLVAMGKGDRLFAARNLSLVGAATKADPSKSVNATFTLIAFKYHE